MSTVGSLCAPICALSTPCVVCGLLHSLSSSSFEGISPYLAHPWRRDPSHCRPAVRLVMCATPGTHPGAPIVACGVLCPSEPHDCTAGLYLSSWARVSRRSRRPGRPCISGPLWCPSSRCHPGISPLSRAIALHLSPPGRWPNSMVVGALRAQFPTRASRLSVLLSEVRTLVFSRRPRYFVDRIGINFLPIGINS